MTRTRLIALAAALIGLAALAFVYREPPAANAQLGSASPVSTTVSVGTASVQVLPANASRHGVIFYNQSAYVISILPGTGTAVASAGGTINLPASGGMLSLSCWNTYPCGNAFQAISTNAASALTLWEF